MDFSMKTAACLIALALLSIFARAQSASAAEPKSATVPITLDHDRVVIEMAAPAGAPVDLFAEGPTPDWMLPLPEPAGPETGATRRFTFDLDGLPAGVDAKGATLILTAVSGDNAIEVPVHLD